MHLQAHGILAKLPVPIMLVYRVSCQLTVSVTKVDLQQQFKDSVLAAAKRCTQQEQDKAYQLAL